MYLRLNREQTCHLESERSALKRREWERRTQEVQQDEDLFSTGFNLFGEPYKTSKGDALASRVQNTLGSYEEMKDLLTSHSNQSHLVGIPKGSAAAAAAGSLQPAPSTAAAAAERSGVDAQLFPEGGGDKRIGSGPASSAPMQPPASASSSSGAAANPHQSSKKSRSSADWSRGGHAPGAQPPGLVGGLGQNGQGQGAAGAPGARAKVSLLEEQQMQRHEELFSSLKDELGLKGDSSPSSSSTSSSSSSSSSRRHSSHPAKPLPLPDGGTFRSSAIDSAHFKSSTNTDSGGHFKSSPFDAEAGAHLSTSSSPLASTSVLTTPTPGLTTPTSGLTTPTFPPGSLSGKPTAVQQKPTAYVRPMDGQDQAPSDSPQLKPPLVATEGFSSGQAYGGNAGNAKNKLPKLSLNHTGEVSLPNDSSCVEEILREMTHSWPPPLTAIHTPGKAEQTKFPIPSKESQHVTSGYNTQKRCTVSANKPAAAKPPTAPQKSMLEDDLKISSDEEEAEQQVSDKTKARGAALSGASGSSSESESSSESDTDESESSSSDSEYNKASRTNTPEPEPPSSNKWQLDSWLNKVQAQSKPLVPPQPDHHGSGSLGRGPGTFSPGDGAPGAPAAAKTKAAASSGAPVPAAAAAEHKDTRAAFCSGRDKAKAKLSQKASGEGQRSKMRLSPGLLSGPEVTTPRRNTTGKKQPKRTERSSSAEDNQSQTWSRGTQHSPAARDKDLPPPPSLEHQNPLRPRSKPPSGKTAPRKEPRGAAGPNAAAPAAAALQQQAAAPPAAAGAANQDKRKHRGPSTRITPKSREFIETDSSSSSSECPSDTEEAVKVPALPPQAPRAAINTHTLSNAHVHTPLLPCLGAAGGAGGLGTFGGKGLRVKDGGGGGLSANGGGGGSNGGALIGCNSLSIGNVSGPFGTSVPDPGGLGGQTKDLEAMSPPSSMGHDVPVSPLRDYHELQSLWVKIDLSLLNRVPGQGAGDRPRTGTSERDGGDGRDRDRLEDRMASNPRLAGRTDRGDAAGKHRRQAANAGTPTEKHTSKSKRRHKSDHGESSLSGSKKLRLDKDCLLLPPCISPIHTHKSSSADDRGNIFLRLGAIKEQQQQREVEAGGGSDPELNRRRRLAASSGALWSFWVDSVNRKQSRRRDEKLLPPLLSPLSDDPPRKRPCDGASSLVQEGGAVPAAATGLLPCSSSSSSSSSASSSSHRHRRGEGKASSHVRIEVDSHGEKPCGDVYHANGHSDSEAWSEQLMDPAEPRRPRLSFSDTVHSADFYMQEAKRLKHKADALMDKFGKAVNYADGALSFIECGNAMERDPLEAKSPYTMYSETVELIRYAMRLKNFTSHSATVSEKKLAVLCNRCLSLLYLRMFHLKKDHAVKYSRSLMEYFKNSAKTSHQAPSPWRTNGKVNGTPSPLSLSPSPAGSGGGGAGGGSGPPPGSSGSVAIPQRIHHMAASHVNITNNILRSYEHWETADRLAADGQDFFQELDSVMEPLSQQSSMTELVRYVRQGLHWLRLEAHLL
ncbi:AF4/FMR2 family member 2 [Salarias fasciatus]|uniref:AF4/FMR2 family member 2 n=1 Tax=Salarias fasciatus TaxID=181472 RepID=UPI0011769A95|nr:AF4/FMR2 family member 2 [Salarias fasciatus]